MLGVTNCEAYNSAFIITDENNIFSITKLYWTCRGVWETFIKPRQSLELREQIEYELHVEKVRKRRNQIKIGDKEFKLSDLDAR